MTADFNYSIKVSNRAKHASLKISSRNGLVVTIPKRFNRKHIPKLIAQKSDWILANSDQLKRYEIQKTEKERLPDHIQLRALEESWSVSLQDTNKVGIKVDRLNGRIMVGGACEQAEQQLVALKKWVATQAKELLVPLTQQLAEEMHVEISKVVIRNQRSRWGSCSRRGEISLNQKLMFVPPEYVEYIIVHELCHVAHPHHGPSFWQAVAEFLPNYKAIDKEMRHSAWETYVPVWAG